LNSSVDFIISNANYINNKTAFTLSATAGTLNISTKTPIANRQYTLWVDNVSKSTAISNETGWANFAYSGTWSEHNFTVSLDIAAPSNLAATSGKFWINWTWDAVTNADDYNIYINGTDVTDSPNLYYNATYSAHATRTISVRGINHTIENFGQWSNLTSTVANNLPVMTSNSIGPLTVYNDENLTATVSATDEDSDPITYSYTWYKDNSSIGTGTNVLSNLISGSIYKVLVIPNDGYYIGTPTFSNSVTVFPRYGGLVEYTVPIISSQNTVITTLNINFGTILPATISSITPTFNLNNKGNSPAAVDAAFTTNSGTYGMINGSTVIPAAAFSLQSAVQQNYVSLRSNGTAVAMIDNVPTNNNENWDIRVAVPSGQPALSYTGIIELTFSSI
jgi:hypothetical protein